MDAIKKHRFWILLGLAIPMILYGYMSANASLSEATTKREGEIKTVEGAVPPSSNPNTRFAEGLSAVNEKHKQQVDAALASLWTEQAKLMTWPPIVAPDVPKTYRGEFKGVQAKFAYKKEYPNQFQKLFESLEPMVPETMKGITWTPKVFVEPKALTVSVFHPTRPTSNEDVWDAQEDLWLMQMLANAIREANKYADGPANATVRSIELFKLLGGSGTPMPKAAAGAASGGGAESYSDPAMMMMSGGQPGAGAKAGGAMINPAEEFGPDSDGAGSGTMDSSMPADGALAGYGASGVAVKRLRYIGTEERGFKERGFYLQIVISQMKIPEFLTMLTNRPWPVRIVRFNMSPNPHEKPFIPGQSMGPDSYPMGVNPMTSGSYPGSYPGGFTESGGYGSSSVLGESYGSDPSMLGGFGGNSLMTPDAGAAAILPNYPKVEDKFGALQNPDLIQLDILGAVTIYNPPTAEEAPATEAAPGTEATPAGEVAAAPAEPPLPSADPNAAPMPVADPNGTPQTPADPNAAPMPAPAPTEGTVPSPMPAATAPVPAAPEEGSPPAPAAGNPVPSTPGESTAAPPATPAPAPAPVPENPGTPAAVPPSN